MNAGSGDSAKVSVPPSLESGSSAQALVVASRESSKMAEIESQASKRRQMYADAISGSVAGSLAAFVSCPMDTIKNRLQMGSLVQGKNALRNPLTIIRKVMEKEGFHGFYRGLSPTLLALIPNWASYFFSYGWIKNHLSEQGVQDGPLQHVLAAMGAGLVTDVITNPFWVVKTRLQTQSMQPQLFRYKNTTDAFRRMIREEGFLSLYKGLLPSCIGVVHVCIQFPLYEKLKKVAAERSGKSKHELTAGEIVAASSISKMIASTIAYPHEVLRSRLQFQRQEVYRGLIDGVRKIWASEGLKGFYGGLGTNLLRTIPVCAVTFTTYEVVSRELHKRWS